MFVQTGNQPYHYIKFHQKRKKYAKIIYDKTTRRSSRKTNQR